MLLCFSPRAREVVQIMLLLTIEFLKLEKEGEPAGMFINAAVIPKCLLLLNKNAIFLFTDVIYNK